MAEEVDVGMPQGLEIQEGYKVRFTALDANGAVVPGVKVSTTVLTADPSSTDVGGGTLGQADTLGDWIYVTGPGW